MGLEKPLFEHDCNWCKFLGTYNGHDLYFCPPQPGKEPNKVNCTVIARYSSEGPDYASGILTAENISMNHCEGVFGSPLASLRVALFIAQELGFYPKE